MRTSPANHHYDISSPKACRDDVAKGPFLNLGEDYIAFIETKPQYVTADAEAASSLFIVGEMARQFWIHGGLFFLLEVTSDSPLSALCGSCERPVSLFISAIKLEQYRPKLRHRRRHPNATY